MAFAGVNSLETGDGPKFAREEHIESWPLARDVGGSQASGLHNVRLGAISEDALHDLLRQLDRVG